MKKLLMVAVVSWLLALLPGLLWAQSGYDLFQKALAKERAEGNIQEAIQLYQRIVREHAGNRALAAKALVQMGQCYEKLGKAEARRAYERVLREYADQAEPVAEARTRLAVLSPNRTNGSMVTRRVWTDASVSGTIGTMLAAVSPDERFLAYVDWDNGDLAVRELANGQKRSLTKKGSWSVSREFAYFSVVSPNGRQIAYQWFNKEILSEVRIMRTAGAEYRIVYPGNPEVKYTEPKAWSPDGQHILANFSRPDGTNQIVLLDVANGSVRVLKTLPWGYPGQMGFSPDGRFIVYDFPPRQDSANRDIFLLATNANREIPLVQDGADDFVLGWAPDGSHILFASDRRGTWDGWAIRVANGRPYGQPELVKQDLGRVLPIGFTRNGSYYYFLRTGMRDVHVGEIDLEGGTVRFLSAPAAARFTGANRAPDWSPDGQYLAYLSQRSPRGAEVLCIRSLKNGEMRELSTGLKAMYRIRWSPDGQAVYVIDYGSSAGPSLFRVDARTGATALVHRNVAEVAVSPDGRTLFYWRNDATDNRFPIYGRSLETGQETEIYRGQRIHAMTLSPDGRLLAIVEWDQAAQSINLKVLPTTGETPRILVAGLPWFSPAAWTPDGCHLIFSKAGQLWRISVEGGEPQRLGPVLEQLSDLRIHPGGRRIVFVAGKHRGEVWVMENFLPVLRAAK